MNKPGPVSEGLAVILWGASAVKVAGYTWQAYTGSYNPFPGEGGGGSNPLDLVHNPNNIVVQGVKAIPGGTTVVTAIQGAARGVAKLFSP